MSQDDDRLFRCGVSQEIAEAIYERAFEKAKEIAEAESYVILDQALEVAPGMEHISVVQIRSIQSAVAHLMVATFIMLWGGYDYPLAELLGQKVGAREYPDELHDVVPNAVRDISAYLRKLQKEQPIFNS